MSTEERPTRASLLVVDDDPSVLAVVRKVFSSDEFDITVARTIAEADGRLNEKVPDAALIDVYLADGLGYGLVERIRSMPRGDVACVTIISAAAEFPDKVEAIRCGADSFFGKPIDWDALRGKLLQLLPRVRSGPGRVLVVEDSETDALVATRVLRSLGYGVRVCGDASRFERDLAVFKPDLIVLDIVLEGGISGYDLAKFVRQNDATALIPIVFLTGLTEAKSRLDAVRSGGDDHLTKPLDPVLLAATIASRLERSRLTREMIERDGLTGLLNRSATIGRACRAVELKKRLAQFSAVLAILDIDHFKAINDTYGHPAGDMLIAGFGAFLRSRLRQVDSLGRYGGDEFMLVLENLGQQDALRLISRLLEEFSAVEHLVVGGSSVRVAFSCGIAVLTSGMDVDAWKDRADRALYAAKQQGRGRVVAFVE